MTGIVIIAGIGAFGLIAFIIMHFRGKRNAGSDGKAPAARNRKTVTVVPKIPQETVDNTLTREQEQKDLSEDLSQSGAITIGAEVKRCIAEEKWDEAIKWLLHAIDALPGQNEFKVTLAEVYAKAGKLDKFIPLFEKLYVDLADDTDDKRHLMVVARTFIPDHTVVKAEENVSTSK